MGWTEEGRIEDCYKLWFGEEGGGREIESTW